jgi:ferredoxin
MFEAFVQQHDAATWMRTLDGLLPSVHEVDRDATRIWFHFFPLTLAQAFAGTSDAEALQRKLFLEGRYRLADQVDTSHAFLYGHRYWSQVKAAIIARAESQATSPSLDLRVIIRDIARDAATAAKETDQSLLNGIAAVGMMTLHQVGLAAFRAGSVTPSSSTLSSQSPAQIVAARKRDDRQSLMTSVFRPLEARYSVIFDERRSDGRFPAIRNQHMTTASARDRRDYSSGDRLCQEGPIPIRCRSGSCGSCWIGVLGGAEKLSAVEPVEAHRLKACGYLDTTESKPVIRLACMARVSGNVTIVIPPWNGVIGRSEVAPIDFNSIMKA